MRGTLAHSHYFTIYAHSDCYIGEEDGEYIVEAQSRNKTLGPKHGGDLAGFAAWTEENKEAFVHVRQALKVCVYVCACVCVRACMSAVTYARTTESFP